MPNEKTFDSKIVTAKISRRHLLNKVIGGAIACKIGTHAVFANDALKEDDPLAIALAYTNDAKSVDASKHANFNPEQCCANCLQFKALSEETNGSCAIFPGKSVAAKGWCKVWAKK